MEATRFDTALKKAGKDLKQSTKTKSPSTKSKRLSMDQHAPKITFVLFDEIQQISRAQSRTQVFDIDQYSEDNELYESIKARGVITPIVVRSLDSESPVIEKRGERAFALVSGHRRVEAAKLAGLKGVPGIMARDEDDHDLMTLAENMGRRELSTYERALAICSLKEDRGFSNRKTAQATGISSAQVDRMVNSFKAPEPLQEMWKKGSLSMTTMEVMKRHWDKFEGDVPKKTLSRVEKISLSAAKELCAQLDLGTDLETSLQSIGGSQQSTRKSENKKKSQSVATPKKDDKTFKSEQKEAIIKALRGVFPKTKAEDFNALFDLAVANNIKDFEVLWAAALYVSRGGKVDQALRNASHALRDRSVRSLIAREVKLMRQVSSLMQGLKRKDKENKRILQTIFVGS
jgi:ParB/RepB/Spo0J family partition protein